jgi:hypothetical protein
LEGNPNFMRILLPILLLVVQSPLYSQDYKKIRDTLESIYSSDQKYRIILDSLVRVEKRKWGDPEIQKWIPIAVETDSINLQTVNKILDLYGWLGKDKIGSKANEALFLVIQHADSTIMIRYFPLLVQSYELRQTPGKFYAMMLDRILVEKGQKQLYGTQLKMPEAGGKMIPYPIENEKEIDIRRRRLGLNTLADYLKHANN